MSVDHKRESEPGNYIVVLVSDNIPNQKFWNAETKDWTSDLDRATIYPTYSAATRATWFDIPEDKVTHRITQSPKAWYLELLQVFIDSVSNHGS